MNKTNNIDKIAEGDIQFLNNKLTEGVYDLLLKSLPTLSHRELIELFKVLSKNGLPNKESVQLNLTVEQYLKQKSNEQQEGLIEAEQVI